MPYEEEILKELKKISKIITLSNGKVLENEIAKYASTNDRKKIWVLIDGIRQADEIVKISGITQAPVYKFLKILEDSSLIERQYGKPPQRLLDYVPAEWIDLVVQTDTKSTEKEDQTTQTLSQQPVVPQSETETHG